MTMTSIIEQHYPNLFRENAKTLPGNHLPWLAQQREQALAEFEKQGFPTTRNEAWKYTDTTKLARHGFIPANQSCIDIKKLPEFYHQFAANRVVFVNGHYSSQLSNVSDLPEGVKLSPLSIALEKHDRDLRPYLPNEYPSSFHAFNTAFMSDGLFLHVPKNTKVSQPIYLLLINNTQAVEQMSNLRHILIAEDNSQASIIVHHLGLNDYSYLSTSITQVIAKHNAHLDYCQVQQQTDKTYHLSHLNLQQEQDSHLSCHQFDLGGGWVRNEVNNQLKEPGAHCSLQGFYLARKKQHIDNHTVIEHLASHTSSTEYYKGILADSSRAVFTGKVIVAKNTQKVNAQQKNHNLLLSSCAEIDTQPQLEIYADDVKCSHGATVGELNQDALFYLESRGIEAQAAKDLLTYGFAVEMVKTLPIAELQAYLSLLIMQCFSHGHFIEELV
jgi:Fe-S cluster assembly protein SufD